MRDERVHQADSTAPASDDGRRCRRKAMDLLARRPHFRAELEAKLTSRGFAEDLVAATCAWLQTRGYLDDREAARRLVGGALRRRGYGPHRMRAELSRRGVDGDIVDEALAEAWGRGEEERALEVARSRVALRGFDRAKLARFLESKGFGAAAIRGVLEKLMEEA